MTKKYIVKLDGQRIGTTNFEKEDAPMGVAIGRIALELVNNPYNLFHRYCQINNVPLRRDEPEKQCIFTQPIQGLTVFTEKGLEIKGMGANITGIKAQGYFVSVFGIPSLFYAEEFPWNDANAVGLGMGSDMGFDLGMGLEAGQDTNLDTSTNTGNKMGALIGAASVEPNVGIAAPALHQAA